MKDSQSIKSLVGSYLKLFVGPVKRITSPKNIVIFLKIFFFISLKIKPTIIQNFNYMPKDDPSSLSVGLS